ncbi:MAG: hypothetical protein MSH25_05450, partial [Desulfovibrio sp.]|uniref:hypothetical protein n=1 Tax=Desulfovibrio sp. TaxID=885 RepID=UPI0025C1D788
AHEQIAFAQFVVDFVIELVFHDDPPQRLMRVFSAFASLSAFRMPRWGFLENVFCYQYVICKQGKVVRQFCPLRRIA